MTSGGSVASKARVLSGSGTGTVQGLVNLASTVLPRYGLQGGYRYLPSGPSIGQLSNATSAATPEGGTTKCMLISGPFSDFVQLSLAVMALSSLIVKRFSETPRRPWLIWFFDVAKQGLGSVYAHFLNMLVAMGLASLTGGSDECAWYFWNFTVDSSVGLVLMILMIKSLECWAGRYPPHSWQRRYVAKSGDYGQPPSCDIWGYQTLVWLCIVSVSKLGLFFFLLAFRQGFDEWGHFLFRPLRGHPQAELVIVMVIVPCTLNVAQFWIVDNVIMARTTTLPPPSSSATLSPTKDSFTKVSYRPMLDSGTPTNERSPPLLGPISGEAHRHASPQRRRLQRRRWWWPFSSPSYAPPSYALSSRQSSRPPAASDDDATRAAAVQHRHPHSLSDGSGEFGEDLSNSRGRLTGPGLGYHRSDFTYAPPSGGSNLQEPAWISDDGIRLNRRSAGGESML